MNQCTRTTADPRRRGFTLLEVVLGLGLISLLIGGIYAIATASLQMSNSVVENQGREMHLHSFIQVLRRNIEGLPGNGKLSMEPPEGLGGYYESELVLRDYPLAFSWASVAAGSTKVILTTEKAPLGGHQFRVRYLNEEEAEAHDSGSLGRDEGIDLVLIDGIRAVQWLFYNQQTDEWEEDWVRPNQRPSMVELQIAFYDDSAPIRTVFWTPVVADPAQIVQGATRTPNSGTGSSTGSGVTVPGGTRPGGRTDSGGGSSVRRPTPVPPSRSR